MSKTPEKFLPRSFVYKRTYQRQHDICDLGDGYPVYIYAHPYKEELPLLAEIMSVEEHEAILEERIREAKAEAWEEKFSSIEAECKRKQKIIDMPGVGHSANSFGQNWAYEEIKDFIMKLRQTPTDRETEGKEDEQNIRTTKGIN